MPTITVSHSAGPSVTKTFSVGDQTKFIDWWRQTRPLTPDIRTDAQVLTEWATWVIVRSWQEVRSHRAANAGKVAVESEPTIVLT